MAKEPELNINLASFSDDELYAFRDRLSLERAKIDDEWAKELEKITSVENFDPYTFWGERKIKKLGKKFAERTAGLTYLQEVTADELSKRAKYKEEQRYSGKGKFRYAEESEEEFLEKEEIKTESYKKEIK